MQAHERKALSQARLEHAVECLSAARNLLETGNYKSAANRSIKQFSERFKFRKLDRQRGEKTFSTRWHVGAANGRPYKSLSTGRVRNARPAYPAV